MFVFSFFAESFNLIPPTWCNVLSTTTAWWLNFTDEGGDDKAGDGGGGGDDIVQADGGDDDKDGDGGGVDLSPVDSIGQFWSLSPGLSGEGEYLMVVVRRIKWIFNMTILQWWQHCKRSCLLMCLCYWKCWSDYRILTLMTHPSGEDEEDHDTSWWQWGRRISWWQ